MPISVDLTAELAAEILNASGCVRSVARGASMLPSIFPGDTLEIRARNFDEVRAGDVVLAMNGDQLYTHRVVREEVRCGERAFITRGDALRFEDRQPVGRNNFLGRVDLVARRSRRFPPQLNRSPFHSGLRVLLRHSIPARAFVVRFNLFLNFLAKNFVARPVTIDETVARHS